MWSKLLRTLNPYQAVANTKPRIVDSVPGRKKRSLVFGYAECPDCTCRNPKTRRQGSVRLSVCLCCRKPFIIKDGNFDQSF